MIPPFPPRPSLTDCLPQDQVPAQSEHHLHRQLHPLLRHAIGRHLRAKHVGGARGGRVHDHQFDCGGKSVSCNLCKTKLHYTHELRVVDKSLRLTWWPGLQTQSFCKNLAHRRFTGSSFFPDTERLNNCFKASSCSQQLISLLVIFVNASQ